MLPAGAGFTRARLLVVGDLVRRVLEDLHSVQALVAVITEDQTAGDPGWRSGLGVRPITGVVTTRVAAEADMSKPLDLMITVAGSGHQNDIWPQVIEVAPANAARVYSGFDLATVRLALAIVDYARPFEVTRSVLEHCQSVLDRWRDRVDQWSRHPSRPIRDDWRSVVISAFDDDLDVARVVAMMGELEDAGVEPGEKFEAFTYLDRVLAVDLARNMGRIRQ